MNKLFFFYLLFSLQGLSFVENGLYECSTRDIDGDLRISRLDVSEENFNKYKYKVISSSFSKIVLVPDFLSKPNIDGVDQYLYKFDYFYQNKSYQLGPNHGPGDLVRKVSFKQTSKTHFKMVQLFEYPEEENSTYRFNCKQI